MRVAFLYNESSEDPAGVAEDGDPERSPIVAALRNGGHEVVPLSATLNLSVLRNRLERADIDVAFNRVESLGGSDALAAAVPLLLDTLRIPYTGCPTTAILATVNKLEVKQKLESACLPTPAWITTDSDFGSRTDKRFILKSVLEHASFAIDDASIVDGRDREGVREIVREFENRFQRPYFAEAFIEGREFNLAVLGGEPTVLPPAEIDFSAFPAGKPRIVGRGAKFDIGSFEYENTPRRYDFPAADNRLLGRLTELSAECWRLFELHGYVRVDFRVDANNEPWILEINSNPCLSPDSGFAAAAAETGIGYDQLIERIVCDAVHRAEQNNFSLARPTNGRAVLNS